MNWDANLIWVLFGSLLLAVSAALVGSFAVLRQRALIGDVLAHAALPGIMVAFILFESKSAGLVILSALASSLLGYYLIGWITRHSKLKADSAMAIVLSSFFALGLMALSYIQASPIAHKGGLDRVLFGQAASMTQADVYWLSAIALLSLGVIVLLFHKLRLISFHRAYAQTLGLNVQGYELVFALTLVLTIVIGLQIVGVILMAAVLLVPYLIARFWSHHLHRLLMLAAIAAGLSALSATFMSYHLPGMPTGPWTVFILGIFFWLSWLLQRLRRPRPTEPSHDV
ncbi:MAG: metal ABC transporter permease [Thiomicrospira sp.]